VIQLLRCKVKRSPIWSNYLPRFNRFNQFLKTRLG
jgi:hypothetical protein